MGQCSITPKIFLTILTLIFWAASASLIFVGSWVYIEYQHFEQIAQALYTLVPATILLAVGVFFFILGLIGCVGACKEQKCILGLYFTVLLLILIGVISAGILGYVYRQDVDDGIGHGLEKALNNYGVDNDTVWKNEVDFMQHKLHCCGIDNYTSWHDTPWSKAHNKPYPESCCINKTCHYGQKNDTALYTNGCYNLVKDQFIGHLAVVAGVAAAFAVVMLVGMICSCLLICKRQASPPYIGLTSPDHMRV
jgi:tetraspanin-3